VISGHELPLVIRKGKGIKKLVEWINGSRLLTLRV